MVTGRDALRIGAAVASVECWKLIETLVWFLIIAVALWIIVELIGAAVIAMIAVRGPTWAQ